MPNTVVSVNKVKCLTSTSGTGSPLTFSTAVLRYVTPTTGGMVGGRSYKYLLEQGDDFEINKGTFSSGAGTITRMATPILSSTGSKLNLNGVTSTIGIIDDAEDENGGRAMGEAQGLLTPSAGSPIVTTNVTGATSMYWEPYRGNRAPVPDKDGFGLVMREVGPLSQALNDTTKSPAAAGNFRAYDWWMWDDAGTLRCTRGPGWTDGGRTFTVTIASPAVFTLNGHNFFEGQPIVLTNSGGALPTGLTSGNIVYVSGTGLAANTFQASSTPGGASINTSGAQSGTHTATTYVQVRGTGAGSEEHDTTTYPGYRVNKFAITNGPPAGKGLYMGSGVTNASGIIDWIVGGVGVAGGESTIQSIWNYFGRRDILLRNFDNTDSWSYTTATTRIKNGNLNNRIQVFTGLVENPIYGRGVQSNNNNTTLVTRRTTVLQNTTLTYTPAYPTQFGSFAGANNDPVTSGAGIVITLTGEFAGLPTLGWGYLAQTEFSAASGTTNWHGDNGAGANTHTSLFFAMARA